MKVAASGFARRFYWLFLVLSVNVPGFTKFDTSGKTHDFGLFNPQSISRIILTMMVGGMAFLFYTTRQSNAAIPQVRRRLTLLLLLFTVFSISAVFVDKRDLASGYYRLFEWGVEIIATIGLYASWPERPDKLTADLLYKLAVYIIGIVCLFAIVAPDLALQSISEGSTGFIEFRFGGAVYWPNTVGTLAAIATYYALLFRRGAWRVFLVLFFFAVLVFTYSRGALFFFLIGYIFMTFFYGKLLAKAMNMLGAMVVVGGALFYQDKVVALLSRGGSTSSLTAASGRLFIWLAGWKMFTIWPFLGWGYASGTKRHIMDYYTNSTFAPEHLHSEILQALASAGFLAGILLVLLYSVATFRAFRQARLSVWQQFLLFAFIQLIGHAVEGPIFSYILTPIGGATLICMVNFGLVQRYGLPPKDAEAKVGNRQPNVAPVAELESV